MEIKYNKNGSISKKWLKTQGGDPKLVLIKALEDKGLYLVKNENEVYSINDLILILKQVNSTNIGESTTHYFKKEKNYLNMYYYYCSFSLKLYFKIGQMDLSKDDSKMELFNKDFKDCLYRFNQVFEEYKKENEWVFNYLQEIDNNHNNDNNICEIYVSEMRKLMTIAKYGDKIKGFKFNKYNKKDNIMIQLQKYILKKNYLNIYNQDKYKTIFCNLIDYAIKDYDDGENLPFLKQPIEEKKLLTIIKAYYNIGIKNLEMVKSGDIMDTIKALINSDDEDYKLFENYNAHNIEELNTFVEKTLKSKAKLNKTQLNFYKKYNNIKLGNNLIIKVPTVVSEIVNEANSQRNCLERFYLDKLLLENDDNLIIFFIRQQNNLKQSYLTCEYNPLDKEDPLPQIKLKLNQNLPKEKEQALTKKLLSIFNND